MTKKPVLRVAAKAVIEAEGSILLLHPSAIDRNRNWHIAGGIRDNIDEPISQTAVREVLEETGIDLETRAGRVFKVGEWPALDKGEETKVLAVFFHFVLPSKPKILLSDEHDEYAWVDLANYKTYQANQEDYEVVEELLG